MTELVDVTDLAMLPGAQRLSQFMVYLAACPDGAGAVSVADRMRRQMLEAGHGRQGRRQASSRVLARSSVIRRGDAAQQGRHNVRGPADPGLIGDVGLVLPGQLASCTAIAIHDYWPQTTGLRQDRFHFPQALVVVDDGDFQPAPDQFHGDRAQPFPGRVLLRGQRAG